MPSSSDTPIETQAEPGMLKDIQTLFADKLMLDVSSTSQNLLETGVLDSLRLLDLLFNLEQHFGIRIAMEELDTEDLRSMESIAVFVSRQRTPAHASVA